jgi:hypothetical protein
VVFECDFQVIWGGGYVVDWGGNELESYISLDEELDVPLRPKDMDNTP